MIVLYAVYSANNLLEVKLHKWSRGLGFSVLGGADVHPDPLRQVVRIKKIFPTGPASAQGELKEGDVILEVNDTMTRMLKHQEVMNLLRSASDEVTLLICRPSDMDLPRVEVVAKELEVLGTTSPTPEVNIDVLSAPATYSDVDETLTSARESICSQSLSVQASHDDLSYHEQSQTEEEEEEEEEEDDSQNSNINKSLNKSIKSLQNETHTPSPVADFLREAGLADGESAGAATPSVDRSRSHSDLDDSQDYEDDRDYEISLTKGDKGLGFTVAGSHHIDGYFYVKDVLYDPAMSSCIESGHRLLEVDGQDMMTLTHREAVAYLRQTPTTVKLLFYIPTEEERQTAEAKATVPKSFKENFKNVEGPQSTSTPRQSVDPGVNTSPLKQDGAKSTRATPTSPREVNTSNNSSGNNPDNTEESDAHEAGLSTASSFGNLSLPMPGDDVQEDHETSITSARSQRSDRSTPSIEAGVLRVTLQREDQGYGFSLVQAERGMSSALFVRTITPDGVAHHDGQLHVGDRLLQVNGKSVIGMAHNKAVSYIKNSKDRVQLTLTRSTPSTTPTPVRELEQATTPANSSKTPPRPTQSSASPQPHNSKSSPQHKTSVSQSSLPSQSIEGETAESRLSREGQQAFLRLVENRKGQETDTETNGSWGDAEESVEEVDEEEEVPPKPPRKNPFSRLPQEISNSWLETLMLAQPPADSVHYSGRQLHSTIKHIRNRLDQEETLEEYKVLKHAKLTDNCLEARKHDNKGKNKYRNVLPYDANRVKLSGPEDYINASYVTTSVGQEKRTYIASQGPMPHTTGDFWRMVWEQSVEVIVMVTRDMEDNKVKCHRYWPDSVSEPFTVWDRFEISLVQTSHMHDFDMHHIKMEDRNTGRVHRVVHLAFSTWPDQGVPTSPTPLLRYIRFVRLVHQSGPLLVHCSTGIGRTGVLITIDVILAMIDRDIKFDIQKIVQDLRRQRQGMIQVTDQYKFCYMAALEALESLEPH